MNALTLTLVFLALLVGFVLLGRHYERQALHTEFQQSMVRMAAAFQDLQTTIGEQFLPVMQQTTTAFQRFAEALRREDS